MTQSLQKGSNISLSKIAPTCHQIIIAIKWLNQPNDETDFDIDGSAFMLAENNKIRQDDDFIFYNHPQSPNKSIELINTQEANTQFFKINLANIPQQIKRVAFVLTLHDAKKRQQNFGLLNSIVVKVLNAATKEELAVYILSDIEIETALILTELYRYNEEWKLKAIGQGYIDGLDVLARNYGVNIESAPPQSSAPKQNKPTVVKYIEAVKPNIEKYQSRAKRAKHDSLNESGTRLLIDAVLQGILGYKIEHIKTEQKIPNRQLRVDYIISLKDKNIFSVEAKAINLSLTDKHISQATSYAYYLKLDFALLTNGIDWMLFYIVPKKYKKYESHLVFSINLLEFDDKVVEKLFAISKFGIIENSLENLKAKMQLLDGLDAAILSTDVIEKITSVMNSKGAVCQVTPEDVRHAIEMNLLK